MPRAGIPSREGRPSHYRIRMIAGAQPALCLPLRGADRVGLLRDGMQ
jgi:hypothetical protein